VSRPGAGHRGGRGLARAALAALLGTWWMAADLQAQAPHLESLAAKFQDELEGIARSARGVLGVTVLDLETGARFGVNQELVFPQGSAIKVPVLVELYRQADAGGLRLDERLPVRAADKAGGSGVLQGFGDGTSQLSLRDLAVLMIVLSDNTATNLLIERVGMERVSATMRELGFPSIRLQRRMIQPQESARGNENVALPGEAAALMARIHRCELPMGPESCQDLRRILEIPRSGTLPAGVPAGIPLAWKSGTLEGVAVAWGIVGLPGRPYVVTVMLNYGDAAPAAETLRQVSASAYDYFARLARATPHGARVPLEILRESAPGRRP
jgi:beta-lactamase class A